MSWTIDAAFKLSDQDGQNRFTWSEYQRAPWPPCPECGAKLIVEPIRTPDLDGNDTYIPGRVRCTEGHGRGGLGVR